MCTSRGEKGAILLIWRGVGGSRMWTRVRAKDEMCSIQRRPIKALVMKDRLFISGLTTHCLFKVAVILVPLAYTHTHHTTVGWRGRCRDGGMGRRRDRGMEGRTWRRISFVWAMF